MIATVIGIESSAASMKAAARCINSGAAHGINVVWSAAITPADEPAMIAAQWGISLRGFNANRYSRFEPCVAAFLSHYSLWGMSVATDSPVLILEHDAVFVAPLPDLSGVRSLCNLGKPSFGEFVIPPAGIGPFASKAGGYLGGAHGYYVTPLGALDLIQAAGEEAEPTDVFINRTRFPWIEEAYPWPIEAHDTFTTIQRAEGCKAKHNRVEVV